RSCGDGKEVDTKKQREVIRNGVSGSILQVLDTANGKPTSAAERFAALRYLPISYQDAATSKDLWKQKLQVLKAIIQQNVHIIADAGLKAALLAAKKV